MDVRSLSRAVLALGAVMLALPAGLAQQAGAITGRVEARLSAPAVEHHAAVASLAARRRPPVDRRRSVVYLDPAPSPAFDDLRGRRARIDQRDEAFVPHVLAITVGTTVDFPNNDVTFHNVFSLSRVKAFDLGRYAAGKSRSVTFDRPGIVRVFCDIHSHMSAFVLVFSHRYFAVTDAEGRFRIPDVPPGTYTLRVWNEGTDGTSRSVTVAPGAEADVHLVVGKGSAP